MSPSASEGAARPLRLACVGAGYWGKNLVRNFAALPGVELAAVCDLDEGIRNSVQRQYPDVAVSADLDAVLDDERLEAVVIVRFADGKMAQLQLSWLDPHKIRKLTLVGSQKMVVFDDVESVEKIRIYDKAAERREYESYGDAITLRFGDVTIPHIRMSEPLKIECQHFVDCIRQGKTPLSDGRDGLRVVRVLEAAQRSLEADSRPITLEAGV